MLSRHPELARKMKADSAGERVLDEEAMMTARAILRKENRAKLGRSSASSAADEINILAAKNKKAAERPLCHTQELCHHRQEIKAVIALMLRYLVTLYGIFVRGEFCNDLINGFFENAVIVEQHTLFVKPSFERDTTCGEGDADQHSLVSIY